MKNISSNRPIKEIEDAIKKGKRVFQRQTKLIESFYSHFSVVFDEKKFLNTRKIFPITVKVK